MPYYVYIVLCEDGSYYTGYAEDVETRFQEHLKGYGARYTRMHKPVKIVYVEEFRVRADAMQREKAIKSLSHTEKQQLVEK